jgi:hypothetical protein
MARTRRESSDPFQKLLLDICRKGRQIPQEFHRIIVQKAQEKIRLLNAKAPPPISANDTPDSRNAVVLEFILRKGITLRNGLSYQEHVPLADFGREIGRSEKHLDSLSASLRPHLLEQQDGIPRATKQQQTASSTTTLIRRSGTFASGNASKRIQKYFKLDSNQQGKDNAGLPPSRKYTGKPSTPIRKHIEAAKAARNSCKNTQSSKSTIPIEYNMAPELILRMNTIRPVRMHELSIKLQNKLHDPNACEKAAIVLFLRLIKHMVNDPELKTLTRKKSAIHEIEQNLKMYEGCCFFIAAKEIEKGENLDWSAFSTIHVGHSGNRQLDFKNGNKRKKMSPLMGLDAQEDEENIGITIEDIATQLEEIPSQLSKFLVEITPRLKEMNISGKKDTKHVKQDAMTSINVSTSRRKEASNEASLSREEYIEIMNSIERNDAEELCHDQTLVDDTHELLEITKPIPPYNHLPQYRNLEAYNEWREKCLQSFMEISTGNMDEAIERRFIEILK